MSMSISISTPRLTWVFFLGTLMGAQAAQAQLAQNLLIGNAKALSLGNAVTADPPGIDSIHYNPAGLTRIKGWQRQLKLITADVSIEGEFRSNDFYDCFFDEVCSMDRYKVPAIHPDPYMNSKSEVEKFAIYVPGSGVTELPFIAAPLGGASYQPPGSSLTFATAVYAPLILGFTRDDDDPGKFYGRELGLSRITYFSPSIGWKYSESLSFGVSIGFSYFGAGLELDYRAPSALVGGLSQLLGGQCDATNGGGIAGIDICQAEIDPFEKIFTLEADVTEPFSPTVNVGLLWEPTDWFTFGMVYQSESSDRLEGDINVLLADNITQFLNGIGNSNALLRGIVNSLGVTNTNGGRIQSGGHLDLTMPQHLAAGVSLQVTPAWKVNIDYKWTETSVWDEFAFYFDQPLPILNVLQPISGVEPNALIIPRGYEDVSNFAYGIEYQYNDKIALRAGYEPRKSGIPDDKLDFLIPLGDFDLYGLGFSYKLGPDEVVDVALGYAKSDQDIPHGSSTNGNDSRADNFVYNPSAGMDVRSVLEATLLEFSYQSRF